MHATSHMYATMYTTCVYVHNIAQVYNVKTHRVYVYNVYILIVYNVAQVHNYVYNAAQVCIQCRTCMQLWFAYNVAHVCNYVYNVCICIQRRISIQRENKTCVCFQRVYVDNVAHVHNVV